MAKQKHHVFSARTTEEGLRRLGEIRQERRMGWDELVIDAVCDRYGLDRAVMAPPKKGKPAEEADNSQQQPAEDASESHLEVGLDSPGETPAKRRGKGKGKK